ncbi:LOB domain-containing protein 41-like protein [Cinnamomum micranthum f. kanehirae]|uniref:LOB domain-containing protein 41-like protein n=1 Tax=Cinnamomum micranthum f. kanehirae TaxID=337451 RepID=A0A3S3N7J5_9MAGN|nr:LOB domain-containing protein 41-like protein [Cinnamomum micranthum f. kanehirae]
MRMSCNGCRALRKGCSDNCTIRPCLQWIHSPQSQANATIFLAKFYGRAGLLNLINAGPEHLRPAIFRSLLHEACGRIVNPIYGSVGLLSSGSWKLCQSAVEDVLNGAPIIQLGSDPAPAPSPSPQIKAGDIRHVSKQEPHRVKTRTRFKRVARKPKTILELPAAELASEPVSNLKWTTSHDSLLSHHDELNAESDSAFSVETVEDSLVDRAEPEPEPGSRADENEQDQDLDLGLTLGFGRI